MDIKQVAMVTAVATARSFDELAKMFIEDGDIESAKACRQAAKAAEKTFTDLKGDMQ